MLDFIFYTVLLMLLAGGGIFGAVLLRAHLDASSSGNSGLFGTRAERRLDVVDQARVDSKRKLLLIRRDRVEHLIMTGGPVDVVIETDIGSGGTAKLEAVADVGLVRAPRTFGKTAAGE